MPSIEPVVIQSSFGDDPPTATLHYGQDCRESLRRLPDQSVHTVCTSPPYWGLRDYGNDPSVWGGDKDCDHEWGMEAFIQGSSQTQGSTSQRQGRSNTEAQIARGMSNGQWCQKCGSWLGQLGLEPSPYDFVSHLVEIFSEVKRVLRDDGTLWLNLGDSYANPGIQSSALSSTGGFTGERVRAGKKGTMNSVLRAIPEGIKYKDLVGIPWMVAFALRANGWYLRADIIWAKSNPMPESVTDRPTKAHEYVFLLTKSEKYYYDAEAIKESSTTGDTRRPYMSQGAKMLDNRDPTQWKGGQERDNADPATRNKRSVWRVNTKPYRGAHFATWPEDLVEPMVLAGCPKGGTVLDPFSGSATTGKVANAHGRNYVGLDANANYLDMATARLRSLPAPQGTQHDSDSILDMFG